MADGETKGGRGSGMRQVGRRVVGVTVVRQQLKPDAIGSRKRRIPDGIMGEEWEKGAVFKRRWGRGVEMGERGGGRERGENIWCNLLFNDKWNETGYLPMVLMSTFDDNDQAAACY